MTNKINEYKKGFYIQLWEVEKDREFTIDLLPILINVNNINDYSFHDGGFNECSKDDVESIATINIRDKGILDCCVFFQAFSEYSIDDLKEITLIMELVCSICDKLDNNIKDAITLINIELSNLNYVTEITLL